MQLALYEQQDQVWPETENVWILISGAIDRVNVVK